MTSLIYWADVSANISILLRILGFVSFLLFVLATIAFVALRTNEPMVRSQNEEMVVKATWMANRRMAGKLSLIFLSAMPALILIAALIPSRSTLYTIAVTQLQEQPKNANNKFLIDWLNKDAAR